MADTTYSTILDREFNVETAATLVDLGSAAVCLALRIERAYAKSIAKEDYDHSDLDDEIMETFCALTDGLSKALEPYRARRQQGN